MPEFKVENMTCGHCVSAVTKAVKEADPAAQVRADLAAGRVEVASALPPERLAEAIRAAGYPAQAA